jgi:phospholipase/carboxylesterase
LKILKIKTMHDPNNIRYGGKPLKEADRALLLLHGRGAAAENMLDLAATLDEAQDFAWLAPQAKASTWYPHSFLAPESENQPWLGSAVANVKTQIGAIVEAGIPAERIWVLGFSQGACLTLEATARYAQRYGGIIALTGGLIGQELNVAKYKGGKLKGTPVYISAADFDPHVPLIRAQFSERVLRDMGANVELQVFSGKPHSISPKEIAKVKAYLQK